MNRIKFRRGSLNNKKNIDIEDGEPIYLTDTKRLYVSNEDVAINNVYVGSQEPNDPGINVWIDPQGINSGVIDMMYPIGSIYISATNTDPSSTFGGTWELVDKEFKSESINNISFFNANTSNCAIKGLYLTRNGHDIKIRFNFSNNIALSDSPINLGSFDFAGLGIIELPFSLYYLSGLTDDGNGVFIALVDYATGNLEVRDVVTKTSGGTIPSGSSCYLLFEFTTTYDMMIDSFCDKFYWKRVS